MKRGSMIPRPSMIVFCSACMLDIIWNVVEDEYLTVIMYLLCSILMRFSGKTSQMIHNYRTTTGSRGNQAETGTLLTGDAVIRHIKSPKRGDMRHKKKMA